MLKQLFVSTGHFIFYFYVLKLNYTLNIHNVFEQKKKFSFCILFINHLLVLMFWNKQAKRVDFKISFIYFIFIITFINCIKFIKQTKLIK